MTSPQTHARRGTFALAYAVEIDIDAPAERIWSLLTDAGRFPEWNSTVAHIDGEIAEGERIKLRAHVAPDREFKLRVRDVVPAERMIWSDGFAPMFKGVRTYTLKAGADGRTRFAMEEVFSGLMLPMIKKALPDFTESFERFAADLKTASERPQA